MDVVTNRLFHINIFPRLHCPHAHQCVPVIRCRTGQDVDAVHVECLPNIGKYFRRLTLHFGHLISTFTPDLLIDINNGSDHSPWVLIESTNVLAPTTIHASDTNTQLLIGALSRCFGNGGRSNSGSGGG